MPTVSFDLTAQQINRAQVAIGKYLNLKDATTPFAPRDATNAEVRAWLIGHLKQTVLRIEKEEALKAIADAPFDVT